MTALISDIINSVKNRVSIPDSGPASQAAYLLEFCQAALDETVFPEIMNFNEEFNLHLEIIQLRDSQGNLRFPGGIIPFPSRAYGRNLREVKFRTPSGQLMNCPLINLEDLDVFQRTNTTTYNYSGSFAFYVRNDEFVLVANDASLQGNLEVTYGVKAPTLSASTTLNATITNAVWANGTTTFTVTSAGTDFDTAVPSLSTKRVDIFRKSSGSWIELNLVVTRTNATTITTTGLSQDDVKSLTAFQTGGFSGITSGYSAELVMLPAEQSNFSPIPAEADNFLVLATCGRVLEAVGDTEGLQVNELKMEKMRKNLSKALAKRVTGEPKIIANRRGIRAYTRPTFVRGW